MKVKIKKNLALSDSGFIFDPSSGDSFSTNPIGLEIIRLIKAGKSTQEIKAVLLKNYYTDEATVEKDYYDFVNTLNRLKLTDGNEEEKN
jgi:hypothetical protein